MPPIPPYGQSGLAFGLSAAIDGKLYVLGTCLINGATCGQAFERYTPATNTWTLLPRPPVVPEFTRAGGVLNKKFYVTDGKVLEVYDPATNRWTMKAPMPSGRSGFTFAAANNRLYVVGGSEGDTPSARVDVYDPVTNTWTKKAPIPRVEWGLSAGRVVVNGQARLEVVGGARPGNNLQYIP
jgi:N-acetylneuraminic acid mutarotase